MSVEENESLTKVSEEEEEEAQISSSPSLLPSLLRLQISYTEALRQALQPIDTPVRVLDVGCGDVSSNAGLSWT